MKLFIYNILLFSHIILIIILMFWAEFRFIKNSLEDLFKLLPGIICTVIILSLIKIITIKFTIWFILFYELALLTIFVLWCKGAIISVINCISLALGLIVLNLFELALLVLAWSLKLIFNVLYRMKHILILLLLYNFGVTPLWIFNSLNDWLQFFYQDFLHLLDAYIYWWDTRLWEKYNYKYWSLRDELSQAYFKFQTWKMHNRVMYSRHALVRLLGSYIDVEAENFHYVTKRRRKYRRHYKEVIYHRRLRSRHVFLPNVHKEWKDMNWAFNFEKMRMHVINKSFRWVAKDLIFILPKLIIRYIKSLIILSFWYTPEKILISYINYDWYYLNLWYLYKYWKLLYFKLTFSMWYKVWVGIYIEWPIRLSPYIIKWYYPMREYLLLSKELINGIYRRDHITEYNYLMKLDFKTYISLEWALCSKCLDLSVVKRLILTTFAFDDLTWWCDYMQLVYQQGLITYTIDLPIKETIIMYANNLYIDICTMVKSYQYFIISVKHIYIFNGNLNRNSFLLFQDTYLRPSNRFVSVISRTSDLNVADSTRKNINGIKCACLILNEFCQRNKNTVYPIQWRLYYIGYFSNKFYLDLMASYTRYEYWLLKGRSYFHNMRSVCHKKSTRSVRVFTLLKHKSGQSFFMMDRYQSFKARIFYYKYWLWYGHQPYYKKIFYNHICFISVRSQFLLNFFICWVFSYLVYNMCYSFKSMAKYNLEHLWHELRQKAGINLDALSDEFQWVEYIEATGTAKPIHDYEVDVQTQLGTSSYVFYNQYSQFVVDGLGSFVKALSQVAYNNVKIEYGRLKDFKRILDMRLSRMKPAANKEFILKSLNNILFYKHSIKSAGFQYRRFLVDPLYSSFYYVRVLEPNKLDIFLASGYKHNVLVKRIFQSLIRDSENMETCLSTPQKILLSAKLAERFYVLLRYFDMHIKGFNNWLKYTGAPIITYDKKLFGGNTCYLAHSDILLNEAFFFFVICAPLLFIYFLIPVGSRLKKRKRPYYRVWGFFDMLALTQIKWLFPILFDNGLASDWSRHGKYCGGSRHYGMVRVRKWNNMFKNLQYLSPFNDYIRAWGYYRERPGLIDIKNSYRKDLGFIHMFRNIFKIERLVPYRRMPRHYFLLFIDFTHNKTGSLFLKQCFILKIMCSLLIYLYINRLYNSNRKKYWGDTTYYWLDLRLLTSWKFANGLFIKYAKRSRK